MQEATVAVEKNTPEAGLSFEEFLARYAFQEPATGVWIADGDTVFSSQKLLREFYELHVRSQPGVDQRELIVNRVANVDDAWDAVTRQQLTYCVSDTFGAHKADVVQAMGDAAAAWMAVADVKLVYLPSEDPACAISSAVVFDVQPVNVGGMYIARSFFPASPRDAREVLIDDTAFTPGAAYTLTGVLRHELGHTLGFRHEHTRPEAGTCFENNDWRALTAYDRASVMHYPQCNGTGSWALELTDMDKEGAALLYGIPGSGPVVPDAGVPDAGNGEVHDTFSATVAKGATKAYGPISVQPGTQLRVKLSGTVGDGDLYVRFGNAPTATQYNCRPYLDDSAEECVLTVPVGQVTAFASVIGANTAVFNLDVFHTPRSTTGPLRGDTCADAEAIPTDGSRILGDLDGYATDGTHCWGQMQRDRFYTFTLAQRSNLSLTMSMPINSNYSIYVEGPASTGTCAQAPQPQCGSMNYADLAPGTYYLVILGGPSSAGTYDFTVTATSLGGGPSTFTGESCTAPATLTLTGDVATTTGTTAVHSNDRSGSCGGSLGDVVYAVTTTRAGTLSATVTATASNYRPSVYIQQNACSSSGNLVCKAATTGGGIAQVSSPNLPAGTYYIWVDGVGTGGWTNGPFKLDVALQ